MKPYIFFALIFLSLFSACNEKKSSSSPTSNASVLPSASGAADDIMVVLPQNLSSLETKKAIFEKFASPYRILPSEEASFNVSFVETGEMNDLMYRFRNIIFIANKTSDVTILNIAKDVLNEQQYTDLSTGKTKVFIMPNVWSQNQNVIFIFGDNPEDLQETLTNTASSIKKKVSDSNRQEFKKMAFISGINESLRKQIKEYHKVNLEIPSDYKLADNKGSFISLRKDIDKGMIFLFIDFITYDGEVPDVNYGIKLRNERGSFVSSNSANSYMVSDSTLGFLETKTLTDNFTIYENSGLWRMENDFMGGPFINQYIIDKANNRVILLDGFIFAPGEDKKKMYMRQIEAIFSTLTLDK